jgi:hypothetical protein
MSSINLDKKTMRTMTALVDHTLTWVKPRVFKSDYELRFGDELIATLRFQRIFSSTAIAENADGCWTFQRVGFFRKKTIIRPRGSSTILGIFRKNRWKEGGCLELSDNRKFKAIANLWKNTIEFQTDIGETLIHTKSTGIFRLSATVHMNRKCLQLPELPWMVMLGLHLIVMMRRDAAAHASHG